MVAYAAYALSSLLLSSRHFEVRTVVSSIAVIAALVGLGCVNKPAGLPLCSEQGACAQGSICVVGRCRLPASNVVGSTDGRRLVLFPEASAAVSSEGPGGGNQLPAVVALGRGSSSVFLRFAVPVDKPSDISAAFLILEPPRDALPSALPVPIHLAEILEPWRADTVSEGRIPRVGVPERAGLIGSSSGGQIRFEVTRLVKRWAERNGDDHGIAIISDDTDAYGAAISLGVTEGRGPRLEVYVR